MGPSNSGLSSPDEEESAKDDVGEEWLESSMPSWKLDRDASVAVVAPVAIDEVLVGAAETEVLNSKSKRESSDPVRCTEERRPRGRHGVVPDGDDPVEDVNDSHIDSDRGFFSMEKDGERSSCAAPSNIANDEECVRSKLATLSRRPVAGGGKGGSSVVSVAIVVERYSHHSSSWFEGTADAGARELHV